MIVQIMVVIFVALILALAITYSVNELYRTSFDIKKKEDLFYSQDFDPSIKKIYLVGSSQVHRLNSTFIEKYISQTESNYEIYNLGMATDKPSKRIRTLQEIIDSKPVMVVYGIGYRDFEVSVGTQNPITQVIATSKPEETLPQPWEFLYEVIPQTNIIDFSNFDNPQLTTLKFFEMVQHGKQIQEITTPDLTNTPFLKYNKMMSNIIYLSSMMEEKYYERSRFTSYDTGVSDLEVNMLKRIISTLEKNNIKVVLFSPPYSQLYFDHVDNASIEIFKTIMEDISDEFEVEFYNFHDKYADLLIWHDPIHVSMNKKSIIYSSDMAKIILDEIKS